MRAVRRLLEEGQGRRLLVGILGLLVLVPALLLLESVLPRWGYLLFLGAFTALSVYLLHRPQ